MHSSPAEIAYYLYILQEQPGLGLSETWYSWVVSISSLGELIGAIVSGVLLRWFYSKHVMLVNLCIIAVGGIIYGIGKFGWMLILGTSCHSVCCADMAKIYNQDQIDVVTVCRASALG